MEESTTSMTKDVSRAHEVAAWIRGNLSATEVFRLEDAFSHPDHPPEWTRDDKERGLSILVAEGTLEALEYTTNIEGVGEVSLSPLYAYKD